MTKGLESGKEFSASSPLRAVATAPSSVVWRLRSIHRRLRLKLLDRSSCCSLTNTSSSFTAERQCVVES
jgi:hypothetical protein